MVGWRKRVRFVRAFFQQIVRQVGQPSWPAENNMTLIEGNRRLRRCAELMRGTLTHRRLKFCCVANGAANLAMWLPSFPSSVPVFLQSDPQGSGGGHLSLMAWFRGGAVFEAGAGMKMTESSNRICVSSICWSA